MKLNDYLVDLIAMISLLALLYGYLIVGAMIEVAP